MIKVRIEYVIEEKEDIVKKGSIEGMLDVDCDIFTESKIDKSTQSYLDVHNKRIFYTDLYTIFKKYNKVEITKL
jgi:hypothetical protein